MAAEGREQKGSVQPYRKKQKGSSCDSNESTGNRSGGADLWHDEEWWHQLFQETGGMWACCGLYRLRATATGLDQLLLSFSIAVIPPAVDGWMSQPWWSLFGKMLHSILLSLHLRHWTIIRISRVWFFSDSWSEDEFNRSFWTGPITMDLYDWLIRWVIQLHHWLASWVSGVSLLDVPLSKWITQDDGSTGQQHDAEWLCFLLWALKLLALVIIAVKLAKPLFRHIPVTLPCPLLLSVWSTHQLPSAHSAVLAF